MSNMRMKNYRIISLLLVIFVVLSGMCFEDTTADSYFAYASMENSNFNFISNETEISDTHPCTSEMLGMRNNAGIQRLASQFLNQKRQNRISFNFLFFNIFSLSERIKKFFIRQLNLIANAKRNLLQIIFIDRMEKNESK